MAKPKLALIPAAQGSKFYSVLPSSGVGDFDFTRSGSATRINSQGLIETVGNGVSRLSYPMIDGKVVGCPHHILEPQRTNLLPYSEDFSQSNWTKSNSSITSNSVISPNGTLNADKLIEDTSNGSHQVYDTVITASGNFSNSIFVKAAERSKIRINSGSNSFRVDFDLSNGNVISEVGATGNIVSISNGWYKCDISWNTSTVSAQYFLISLLDDSGIQSYQGDGTSGIYIWGAMLEANSFPTSYIPTNGSATTRSAEVANGSGDASTFNDSEGVLMAEISALANSDTTNPNRGLGISSGSTNNTIFIYYQGTLNKLSCIIVSDGIVQFSSSTTLFNVDYYLKIGLKYKQNDFALWVNGVEALTDTSGNTPVGLNELAFDNGAGLDNFYGNTKQVQYYDSALTDSELETLTSWVSFSDMANGQLYTIE